MICENSVNDTLSIIAIFFMSQCLEFGSFLIFAINVNNKKLNIVAKINYLNIFSNVKLIFKQLYLRIMIILMSFTLLKRFLFQVHL